MSSSNQIKFEYFNRSIEPIEIWLSVAPSTKNINFFGTQPINIWQHEFLGSMYYFKVPAKQKLTYTSEYVPVSNCKLTNEERAYFLRNTVLIPVNKDTQKTVQSFIKDIDLKKDKDKVLSILKFIKSNFKYSTDIEQRGFEYTTRNKKGDCYELSAVLASYCRSINIPCRIMVGACKGKSKRHVWNEVYLPEEGWVSLDVSLAMYTFFKHPLRNLESSIKWGAFVYKKSYFGNIEPEHVVFSIDPERCLSPSYTSYEPPVNDTTFNIAGERFSWGYDSLDGRAPYMQPIYPKLNKSFKSIKNKDILGKFETYPSKTIDRMSYKIKMNSLSIVAILVFLSMFIQLFNINTSVWFNILISSGTYLNFGIFSIFTILRKELNWWVVIILVLMSISALRFIYQMTIYFL